MHKVTCYVYSSQMQYKDYLGSLMGLGITWEKIGGTSKYGRTILTIQRYL